MTKTLIPSGSSPGMLYGMAKAHKSTVPLRPVMSMVGTAECKLAEFLDNLIKPLQPDTYLLKSTSQFMDHVRQFKFNKNQIMVSFDAVSLFTKVSLSETIEIIANRYIHRMIDC